MCSLLFFLFQFKIALCQLSVTADKERNIAHARRAIEDAAEKGARLVLLPVSNKALCCDLLVLFLFFFLSH